jgi:hypothetical protein
MNKLQITSGSHFGKNEMSEFQKSCYDSSSIYQNPSNYSKRTVIGGYLNGEFINQYNSFKFKREGNLTYLSKGIAIYDGKLIYNAYDKLVEISESDNTVYSIRPKTTYSLEGTLSIDQLGNVVGIGTKFTKYFRAGKYANYVQISSTSDGLATDSTLGNVFRVVEVISNTSMKVFVANSNALSNKYYTVVSSFGNSSIPTAPERFTYAQEGFEVTSDYTGLPIYQKANGYYYDSRTLLNETYKIPFAESSLISAPPILDIVDIKVSPKGSDCQLYSLKLALKKQCVITAENGSLVYKIEDNNYFGSLSSAILKDEFNCYSKVTWDLQNQAISSLTGITGSLMNVPKTFSIEHASEFIYLRACDLTQSETNIPVYFSKIVNTKVDNVWVELPTNTPNISIQLSSDGNTWTTITFDVGIIAKNCINIDEDYIANGTVLPIVAGKLAEGIKITKTLPVIQSGVLNELFVSINTSELNYNILNNYGGQGGSASYYNYVGLLLLNDFTVVGKVFNRVGYSSSLKLNMFGGYAYGGGSTSSYYQFNEVVVSSFKSQAEGVLTIESLVLDFENKTVSGYGELISEALNGHPSSLQINLSFDDNLVLVYDIKPITESRYQKNHIINCLSGIMNLTSNTQGDLGIRYCDGTNGTPTIPDVGGTKHYIKVY